MTGITKNLNTLNQRISQALTANGRKEGTVFLLAVSKKHDIERVREAAVAGLTDFGENYVTEAVEKIKSADFAARWHYIGRIQSNKTKAIAEHFDWVQTVDREKIARRLNEQRPAERKPLQVLIQVQTDPDDTHGGIEPDKVTELATLVDSLPQLTLRGLMCIPAAASDEAAQRAPFKLMHSLFSDLQQSFNTIDTLSMGMSGDLETAIEEGSTMVRIGTALFGSRD